MTDAPKTAGTMTRRTKTLVAGATGAALALGALGAATVVADGADAAAAPTTAVVANAEAAQPARVTLYGMSVALPEGWGAFYLNKNGALRARGAAVADLGELAPGVRQQLSKAGAGSFLLIDLDTVDGTGVTSMMFTVTETGTYPVATSIPKLRTWMDKVFRKVDASKAVRFDDNKKRPSAWVEYVTGTDGDPWLIREYVFQFRGRALSVHFAADRDEDPQSGVEDAAEVLTSLRLVRPTA